MAQGYGGISTAAHQGGNLPLTGQDLVWWVVMSVVIILIGCSIRFKWYEWGR